jgi:cell division initiation protein
VRVTPLDIDQQQFQRVLRGCDPKEVHRFLDQVSRELEDLIRENRELNEQLQRKDEALSEYRKHEVQLREALVAAGRLTDEVRQSARKEADIIRAEAQIEAERIIQGTQDEVVSLAEEARALKQQKIRLVSELRSVLSGHVRLLDAFDDDARAPKNAGRMDVDFNS